MWYIGTSAFHFPVFLFFALYWELNSSPVPEVELACLETAGTRLSSLYSAKPASVA